MGFNTIISRGTKITPRYINRLAGNVRVSHRAGPGMVVTQTGNHQQYQAVGTPRATGAGAVGIIHWIKITGNALQSGHAARWDYAFTEQDGPTGGDKPNGLSGTTSTDPAKNTLELAHIAEPSLATAWYVWGINAHGTDYPAGTRPRPVGGGGTTDTHKVDQIVPAWQVDGQVWFSIPGSHDGTCA